MWLGQPKDMSRACAEYARQAPARASRWIQDEVAEIKELYRV